MAVNGAITVIIGWHHYWLVSFFVITIIIIVIIIIITTIFIISIISTIPITFIILIIVVLPCPIFHRGFWPSVSASALPPAGSGSDPGRFSSQLRGVLGSFKGPCAFQFEGLL